MDFKEPALFSTDDDLTARGWRAVARTSEGVVASLMAPGFFDEYLTWIGDMERRGYSVTELQTQS